jgi:hypothetical protein
MAMATNVSAGVIYFDQAVTVGPMEMATNASAGVIYFDQAVSTAPIPDVVRGGHSMQTQEFCPEKRQRR